MICTDEIKQMGASEKAISAHYDLDSNFYNLWLDKSMTYTSAYYKSENIQISLEHAQEEKIDFYADFLKKVGKLKRVCDIGCGWGSALSHLVKKHGVQQGVGITLSEQQFKWINEKKPDSRIKICLESWADHLPDERYDGLISIEAFEAFAKQELTPEEKLAVYRHFFTKCNEWLNPGGYFGLQVITFGNSRVEDFDEFIATQIFPESILPTTGEIFNASNCLFEPILVRNDRAHYSRTLRQWLKSLKQTRLQAVELVGEDTVIKYERYLRLCIFMFDSGSCDLLRIIFRKINIK